MVIRSIKHGVAAIALALCGQAIAQDAAAPAPEQTAAATPGPLTVAADQPGPVISRDIFGQFAEHLEGSQSAVP